MCTVCAFNGSQFAYTFCLFTLCYSELLLRFLYFLLRGYMMYKSLSHTLSCFPTGFSVYLFLTITSCLPYQCLQGRLCSMYVIPVFDCLFWLAVLVYAISTITFLNIVHIMVSLFIRNVTFHGNPVWSLDEVGLGQRFLEYTEPHSWGQI